MRLELQEGKEKKHIVLLDGEVYCRCYLKDLKSAGIEEGKEVNASMLCRLQQEVLLPRAKRRSLLLLNKKWYTRQEMQKKLKADGYPEQVIAETLSYLEEFRYIEDFSYAREYASSLLPRCSEREAYQKMLQKGFGKETITEAMKAAREEYFFENGGEEKEPEPPELFAIRTYLRKKGYHPEQTNGEKKQKMVMALYRKGFSMSDIRTVIGDFEGAEEL